MSRIILLHGWTNRRPEGHWMRIAANSLRRSGHQVWYPQFPSPDTPKPEEWMDLLLAESKMMDETGGGEKIAIAHSLGCLNWLQAAVTNQFDTAFDRVLFVAPPDVELTNKAEGIEGEPMNIAHEAVVPAIHKFANQFDIVASDNDHWLPRGIQQTYGDLWGMTPSIIPGAAHFSLEDGWGHWQGLLDWVESSDPKDLQTK